MPATQLIDETELRERFDLHISLKKGRVEWGIRAAARRLRQWVGAAVYDATLAQNGDGSNLSDTDRDRLFDLKDCEAALAMHFLILGLNTQVRPQGLVVEEKLSEGGTVIRLRNAQDTQAFIEFYLQQAWEMARPYRVEGSDSGFEFAVVSGVNCG